MNVPSSLTRAASTVLFVFAALAPRAFADSTTRAARLTLAQGSVNLIQPSSATPIPAQVNLPLLSGVEVSTGSDGRAEIEFEDGSVVRLTPNTALSLDNLAINSDGVFITNLTLLHGLAYAEFRATQQYTFTLNAGGNIFSPLENTSVRIDFDQAPATFSVFDGTAEIDRQPQSSAGYQTQVHTGETLRTDAQDQSRYFLTQQITSDSWDQWNQSLDQQASSQSDNSTTVRDTYAGSDGYGWSDLDANGTWYNVPGEGPVWQPQDAGTDPDFDPYGNGAWVFYPSTGYIWTSSYRWGWTPYRCGAWSYYNGFGWGWAPGSSCGRRGWDFGDSGGGVFIDINRIPRGYRPIRIPTRPHPGPLPPILPVHPWHNTDGVLTAKHRGPLTINGQALTRIEPRHPEPFAPGMGSALRRDFPVDPATHNRVFGRPATPPVAQHTPPQHQLDIAQPNSPQRPRPEHGASNYPTPNPPQPASTNNPEPRPTPGPSWWPRHRPNQPADQSQPSAPNQPPTVYQRPEHIGPPQSNQPSNVYQRPEHIGAPQSNQPSNVYQRPEHIGPPRPERPDTNQQPSHQERSGQSQEHPEHSGPPPQQPRPEPQHQNPPPPPPRQENHHTDPPPPPQQHPPR
ncbi:MAG TPA: DUF6600 domain-containing protein [Acidobacteriaceae bacterium]|nr:DUF6600 domain-containing protein [Acidobacteriaceae bacterium]